MSTTQKLFQLELGQYVGETHITFLVMCCNILYKLDLWRHNHLDEEVVTPDDHIVVDEEFGLIHTPNGKIQIQNRQTWMKRKHSMYRVSELRGSHFLDWFQASTYTRGNTIEYRSPPSEHRTRKQEEKIESWQEYCANQDPDPVFQHTGKFTKPAMRTVDDDDE